MVQKSRSIFDNNMKLGGGLRLCLEFALGVIRYIHLDFFNVKKYKKIVKISTKIVKIVKKNIKT